MMIDRVDLKMMAIFSLSDRIFMLLSELRKMLYMFGIISKVSLVFRAVNPVYFYHSKFADGTPLLLLLFNIYGVLTMS